MSVVNLPPQSDAKQKGSPPARNKLSATEISSAPDNGISPTKATMEKIESVRSDDRVSDDHRFHCSSEIPNKSKNTQNSNLKVNVAINNIQLYGEANFNLSEIKIPEIMSTTKRRILHQIDNVETNAGQPSGGVRPNA